MTRTAILLTALIITTPAIKKNEPRVPSEALSKHELAYGPVGKYDRQNAAIKRCMEADVNDSASFYIKCMEQAGLRFCSDCSSYGTIYGVHCAGNKNGIDRPACWYTVGEKKPPSADEIEARWLRYIKRHGWEHQKPPFAPEEIDSEKWPIKKPVTNPFTDPWDPRSYFHPSEEDHTDEVLQQFEHWHNNGGCGYCGPLRSNK